MAANGIFFFCAETPKFPPRARNVEREREREAKWWNRGGKKKKKDAGADNSASARSWDDVGFISADASRPKCRVRNEWLHFLRPSVGLSLSLSLSLSGGRHMRPHSLSALRQKLGQKQTKKQRNSLPLGPSRFKPCPSQ